MPSPRTSRQPRTPPSARRARPPAPRPAYARRGSPVTTRPQRDWIAIAVSGLPGLAALIALVFASLSIQATKGQLQIAEQGQITDRYNAAITNLGSASTDIRLGGIYALQRLMQDSTRDQPTVIAVLCAFIRDHAPATAKPAHPPAFPAKPPTDIQAALTVVTSRNTANDSPFTVVDLDHAQLTNAQLDFANLSGANLDAANLAGATLVGAHLAYTSLLGANLTDADLSNASLSGASLDGAHLDGAHLDRASFTNASLMNAYLNNASLIAASLDGANLAEAHLNGATLNGATLNNALLTRAGLTRADLTGSNLTRANLTGANLSHVVGIRTKNPTP